MEIFCNTKMGIQSELATVAPLYRANRREHSMLERLHRILRVRAYTESLFSVAALLATIGTSQTIASGIWDAISHIFREPEQFWSIQHVAVYAGVAIVAGSAVTAYALLIWRHDSLTTAQKRALGLVIAGATLQIVSGYADSISHDIYGIDGLVSWSHQPLELGLVISSLGALLLLRQASVRIRPLAFLAAIVLVFSSMWLIFNLLLITNATILCLAVYKLFSSGCAVM